MKSRTTLQSLLLAAGLGVAVGAQANLLTNGSFETGAFVNQGNDTMSLAPGSTVITGWTVVSDITAWIGPTNPFNLTASDGSFFLDLTNYQPGAPFAGISQTIVTTPGATYSLTFDLGSSTQWGVPDSITATVGGTSQTFLSPSTGIDIWTHESLTFVASSAATTLVLQGASGFNLIGLDNTDIEFVSGPGPGPGPGEVPEPATLALLGLGLAALTAARRRRE
ncbi:MAG TPA: DUF642 domain-containing protein [Burkholderiaceae bacterium]|nr:DUF642 domain-containing protein [Burkholderiaceae bacterium]